MRNIFSRQSFRRASLGLIAALVALWYIWLKTDQIISSVLPIAVTAMTLINSALSFIATDRQPYIARFLTICSYLLIGLAVYTLYSLSRGINL